MSKLDKFIIVVLLVCFSWLVFIAIPSLVNIASIDYKIAMSK